MGNRQAEDRRSACSRLDAWVLQTQHDEAARPVGSSNQYQYSKWTLNHSPGSSRRKSVHFLPFFEKVQIFFCLHGSHWKPVLFSRLNAEIYLYDLVIFLLSKLYFSIFMKLCIVSQDFYFIYFSREYWCCAFKGVNLCWKISQVFLEGVKPCQAPTILESRMWPLNNVWIQRGCRHFSEVGSYNNTCDL